MPCRFVFCIFNAMITFQWQKMPNLRSGKNNMRKRVTNHKQVWKYTLQQRQRRKSLDITTLRPCVISGVTSELEWSREGPSDLKSSLDGSPDMVSWFDGPSNLKSSLEGSPDLVSWFDGPSDLKSSLDGPSDLKSSLDRSSDVVSSLDGSSDLKSSLEGPSYLKSSLMGRRILIRRLMGFRV